MSVKKYYAVKNGILPGVYESWDECRNLVHGYPGAIYKSFPTRAEAECFVYGEARTPAADTGISEESPREPYAFVDGSYNAATGVFGYGGFVVADGQKHVVQGSGSDPELASMRNVAGEIFGCMAAVEKARELKLSELTVYYDYAGIEQWATDAWKRNKAGTAAYHAYMQTARQSMKIRFVKVKGHSGIPGNEEADRLAKEACGCA